LVSYQSFVRNSEIGERIGEYNNIRTRIHTHRTKSRDPSTLRARKKRHIPVVASRRRIIVARKRTRTQTFNDGNPLQFKPL
jgi:hypothetical protein